MRIRKQEKFDKRRKAIIEVAKEMLVEDGIDALSIRKIATKLRQSPANMYHYFKNKEEIVNVIVEEGYQEIVVVVSKVDYQDPEKQLYETLKAFITVMLTKLPLARVILFSNHPNIQSKVNILTPGISSTRSSIQTLCMTLEKGMAQGVFQIDNVELRAQVIISSAYGIMQRVITEKPTQQERVIEEYLEMVLQSLKR